MNTEYLSIYLGTHTHTHDPDAGKNWGQEEEDNRGWDGWMVSLTQWTWVWASSRRYWRTEKPGVLQSTGWQRVGRDWVTELNIGHRFDPWSRKTPHAAEQPSLCTTTTEAACFNYRSLSAHSLGSATGEAKRTRSPCACNRGAPAGCNYRKPVCSNEDLVQPKKK